MIVLFRWNRTVVRRVSKKCNHSIKIKGKVRPRGVRGQQLYAESRVQMLRKKCRTQSLWNLYTQFSLCIRFVFVLEAAASQAPLQRPKAN